MKTQVIPRNIQEILLIVILEKAKKFYKYDFRLVVHKFIEIVKELSCDFNKIFNISCCLELSCLQSNRISLPRKFDRDSNHYKFAAEEAVDNHWLNSFKQISSRRYIVVAEGLQMYLRKQQVKQLFDKLIENFSKSQFASDSKLSLIENMSANFDWSISDIREIQSWKSGCRVMETITFANLNVKVVQPLSVNFIKSLFFKYIPLFRNSYRLGLFQLT